MLPASHRRLALGALLGLACAAASAAPAPLSENEMSGVYGQGLSGAAFSPLGVQEQSGAYASAADVAAAIGSLSADGSKNLERQLSQQQVQAATVGLQSTIRMAQALGAATTVPVAAVNMVIPVMPLMMFGLPAMPDLAAALNNGKKH